MARKCNRYNLFFESNEVNHIDRKEKKTDMFLVPHFENGNTQKVEWGLKRAKGLRGERIAL